MFVYHFVDLLRYSLKETRHQNMECWFLNRVLRQLLLIIIRIKRKLYAGSVDFFLLLLVTKKLIAFKSSLGTCTLMPWSLAYFHLPSSGSEMRKTYTLGVLLICLGRDFGSSPTWVKKSSLREAFAWGDYR